MKRADTGATNFTAISWGEDVLEMVEYEPVVYFSDVIEEAEQGASNISPSQAVALESEGRLSNKGKHSSAVLKGKAVNKAGQKIVVEIDKVAGSQQGMARGKISNVVITISGPAGEPNTIRVPPSRLTPQRR